MGYDGTKLICFDGEPHWMMSDGSFVPAKQPNDDLCAPGTLYLKDKNRSGQRLIVG